MLWRSGCALQVCRHEGIGVWRLDDGVATWKARNSGALEVLRACRHRGVEIWSSAALEESCRRSDMKEWSAGAALPACRHGSREI